jgi:nicotinate phosphoribosyltransferase
MGQVAFHHFPSTEIEYEFKCRNKGIDFLPYVDEIQEEIRNLCHLKFTKEDLEYLGSIRFLKKDYVNFLKHFQLDEGQVHISKKLQNGFELKINGPWWQSIFFEVPVLSIINEVYFKNTTDVEKSFEEGMRRLTNKIHIVEDLNRLNNGYNFFKFGDFGTRRRYSREWQQKIIQETLKRIPHNFTGTSNVFFAKEFGVKYLGTMAHEYLMICQAIVRLADSQKFAFETWMKEYRGDLGIALSDVVGMDAFLRDFDLFFAKLFDGARHDSGDPYAWCNKLINHYEKLRINPMIKTALFSDGLTFPSAIAIALEYKNRIQTAFGIGTNYTNDVGAVPLNIVIKATRCKPDYNSDWQDVAKISDSPGKLMCKNESYVNYVKSVFKIKD